MLQSRPDDFVIGTGESHSVQEMVALAFENVGLDWQRHVLIDSRYFRPTEVDELRADSAKARGRFGDGDWNANDFRVIVKSMVLEEADALR
jgi:GDPmannose 4,6-dehydratase